MDSHRFCDEHWAAEFGKKGAAITASENWPLSPSEARKSGRLEDFHSFVSLYLFPKRFSWETSAQRIARGNLRLNFYMYPFRRRSPLRWIFLLCVCSYRIWKVDAVGVGVVWLSSISGGEKISHAIIPPTIQHDMVSLFLSLPASHSLAGSLWVYLKQLSPAAPPWTRLAKTDCRSVPKEQSGGCNGLIYRP